MPTIAEELATELKRSINAAIDRIIADKFGPYILRVPPKRDAPDIRLPKPKKSETNTWTAGGRGRAPVWVLSQTGLPSAKEVAKKYGKGATFTKGSELPARQETQAPQAKGPTIRKKAAAS